MQTMNQLAGDMIFKQGYHLYQQLIEPRLTKQQAYSVSQYQQDKVMLHGSYLELIHLWDLDVVADDKQLKLIDHQVTAYGWEPQQTETDLDITQRSCSRHVNQCMDYLKLLVANSIKQPYLTLMLLNRKGFLNTIYQDTPLVEATEGSQSREWSIKVGMTLQGVMRILGSIATINQKWQMTQDVQQYGFTKATLYYMPWLKDAGYPSVAKLIPATIYSSDRLSQLNLSVDRCKLLHLIEMMKAIEEYKGEPVYVIVHSQHMNRFAKFLNDFEEKYQVYQQNGIHMFLDDAFKLITDYDLEYQDLLFIAIDKVSFILNVPRSVSDQEFVMKLIGNSIDHLDFDATCVQTGTHWWMNGAWAIQVGIDHRAVGLRK